jgi:hypothetical protein
MTGSQAGLFPDPYAAVEPDASGSSASDASHPAAADASRRTGARRLCDWCGRPIPAAARRDAECCSVRCRQARHRFTRAAGRAAVAAGPARRLAYADPPYPGKAWLYRDHPDYGGEVDHGPLIRRLSTYEGWALSTSAAALPAVLALCPPGVRVAAWHRGERPAASWQPLSAWEPVVYSPGRPIDPAVLDEPRTDSLVCGVSALTTLPGRVIGAKPAMFCRWMFRLIGAAPGDTLDDLFPGSGAVTRAWAAFTARPTAVLGSNGYLAPLPEPSRLARADASLGDPHDASHPAARDASRRTSRDASRGPGADAPDPTSADASRSGARAGKSYGFCAVDGSAADCDAIEYGL